MRPWTLPLASLVVACAPVRVGDSSHTGAVDPQEERFYGSGTVVAFVMERENGEFTGVLDGSGHDGFARQPDCDSPEKLQLECALFQPDGDPSGIVAVDLVEGSFSWHFQDGTSYEGVVEDVDLESSPGSTVGAIHAAFAASLYVVSVTIEVDLSPAHACPQAGGLP